MLLYTYNLKCISHLAWINNDRIQEYSITDNKNKFVLLAKNIMYQNI